MSEIEDESSNSNEHIDEETLEKLAVEEILREAVQGAARAEVVGPSGWVRTRQHRTNKRFLVNTLRNAIASNKYHYSKPDNHTSLNSSKRERCVESVIRKEKHRRKH